MWRLTGWLVVGALVLGCGESASSPEGGGGSLSGGTGGEVALGGTAGDPTPSGGGGNTQIGGSTAIGGTPTDGMSGSGGAEGGSGTSGSGGSSSGNAGMAGDAGASGSAGDAGASGSAGAAGAGGSTPEPEPLGCDGLMHGTAQTRIRYAVASAPTALECQPETQTRTCQNGTWSAWSGTFQEVSCTVNNCPALPESRIRFAQPSVDYPAVCVPEVQYRSCTAGVFGPWSGSFMFEDCQVVVKGCGATPHGQSETRVRFREAQVAFGQTCESQQQSRLCVNGELTPWSGTFTHEACEVAAPATCNGSTHGTVEKRVRFKAPLAASIGECVSEEQARTCSNGMWSSWSGTPSFESTTCQVLLNGACNSTQECSNAVCEANQCQCPPNEEPAPDCSGADCCVCAGKWSGQTCDVCPSNWDPAQGCNVCNNHWEGSSCDYCSPKFDAASNCSTCSPGFSGPNCEQDVCVRYVDPASTAAVKSGLSWTEAVKTLAAAQSSVAPGTPCQYWLKAGPYGAYTEWLFVRDIDSIYGGFAGTEVSLSQRDPARYPTVLDRFVRGSGLVDGVTIRTQGTSLANGLTLRNVHFEGGATLFVESEAHVESSTFERALPPAAILMNNRANLVVTGTRFSDLSSAAIRVPYLATATVDGSTIVGNVYTGGMLEVESGTLRVRNSVIAENRNTAHAQGVFQVSGGVVDVINSTVVYNSTKAPGPVFSIIALPTITVTNSIFWGNSGTLGSGLNVTYSIVQGGYAGTGNLSAAPVFTGISPHVYQLDYASAGIDAANGNVAPTHDLTGHRRIDTTYPNTGIGTPAFVDMGAYEWHL